MTYPLERDIGVDAGKVAAIQHLGGLQGIPQMWVVCLCYDVLFSYNCCA